MRQKIEIIKKYLLSKIYTREWVQGQHIPSKKALAIKFETTTQIIMKILESFKQSGLIYAEEKKGYYVSFNESSWFFYSIKEFLASSSITTKIVSEYYLDDQTKKIITENMQFANFGQANLFAFVREYKKQEKIEKISYFIFQQKLLSKFNDLSQIKQMPLYEFLARNGILITHHDSVGYFKNIPPNFNTQNYHQRVWSVTKFIYDIDKKPIGILAINYLDSLSKEVKILNSREAQVLRS